MVNLVFVAVVLYVIWVLSKLYKLKHIVDKQDRVAEDIIAYKIKISQRPNLRDSREEDKLEMRKKEVLDAWDKFKFYNIQGLVILLLIVIFQIAILFK